MHSAEKMAEVINHLNSGRDVKSDRRASPRYSIRIAVPTLPIDDCFRPMGEPFVMMSRNISMGGIALMHTRPIVAEFLAVELPIAVDEQTQLVMQVLHTRKIDGAYEYGGKFVARMATSSATE
jgi:hypothetical protein